jgi:hypothetical protein
MRKPSNATFDADVLQRVDLAACNREDAAESARQMRLFIQRIESTPDEY